jgi:FSR family fosmidomycin resistance protein-like MFS transporter
MEATMAYPMLLLALLAFGHFIVDTIASTLNPLWPHMESAVGMSQGEFLAFGYICWTMANSFAQVLFAYLGDRTRSRWVIWVGPIVAILCLSSIGWIENPWLMCLVLFLAGLGIAAFHPEAAVTAGSMLPGNRSRAMAIFALCGYLGQAVGPYYAGRLVTEGDMTTLVVNLSWALPAMLVVGLCVSRTKPISGISSSSPMRLSEAFSGRGREMLQLIAGGVLRIIPALGIPLSLAYLLETEGYTPDDVGLVQSAFMAGIGGGAIFCAIFTRPDWEKLMLWLPALLATPAIVLIGPASYNGKIALCFSAGFLLGIAMPVFISYAQQLLPQGQRVATSLTMGFSWGIASILVAITIRGFQQLEMLDQVFWFFAAACIACSLVCYLLPRITAED